MTKIENDEKLLKDFFTANKQEIADNGFSRRVIAGTAQGGYGSPARYEKRLKGRDKIWQQQTAAAY